MASLNDRLVITARHCVAGVGDGDVDAVALSFIDPATWGLAAPRILPAKGTVIARGRSEPDDDWAVIQVTGSLPTWVKALPLCELAIAEGEEWVAAGYPFGGVTWDIGDDFGGKVVNSGGMVKLHDPRAPGRAISAISGAACVIEGRAYGVITRADEHCGISTTGTCYAVPFSRVARDMLTELRFERDPPFLAQAEWCLERGTDLQAIVEQLLRESAAEIRRLARFVARHSLVRGVMLTAEVAHRALARSRGDAKELIDVAAAQWFPVTSARWLATQLTAAPPACRAAALNVDCPDLATLCVRRAGFELNGEPEWHTGRIDVSWLPGVDEDELVGEVTSQLYQRLLGGTLGPSDDWRPHVPRLARELTEWFDPERDRWRLQFVMLPVGSPRTAVDRLAALYPALAIIVPTGGDDIITADVPVVDPALRGTSSHLADWRRAYRQLQLRTGVSP